MLLNEGQMSDHKGAGLALEALPPARTLIADRGYDSKSFREALQAKDIDPCIPSSRSRKVPYPYDKGLYRPRHKVENLFAKLKDWRRIATRYDRCAHTFFSAMCIAAAVSFWLTALMIATGCGKTSRHAGHGAVSASYQTGQYSRFQLKALQKTQRCRALLQQTQTLPGRCNPLRQMRRRLPRIHTVRFNSYLDTIL